MSLQSFQVSGNLASPEAVPEEKIQTAQFYLNASVLVEICLNFGEGTGLVLVEGRCPEVKLRVDNNIVINLIWLT